ncbi:hypothetical protein [Enterobacter hormaechei]|uniref:hypothetical protein n=1 Tax=Enterobacter hormaechei TaxID=158836 RepID=UPI003C30268D
MSIRIVFFSQQCKKTQEKSNFADKNKYLTASGKYHMFRQMTNLEIITAELLVKAGENTKWEYSAILQSSKGPLLEVSTEKLPQRATPSDSIMAEIMQWPEVVLHHNHLSGESLSLSDWRGTSVYFNEIYAHCNDMTSYYGKVLDKERILSLVNDTSLNLEIDAENTLFNYVKNAEVAGFFRKDVICRAFKLRGYVEYGYSWGILSADHMNVLNVNIDEISSVGKLGRIFDPMIDMAASEFTKKNW